MTLNRPNFTNMLVFSGLLFTTARMVRGTDDLYFLSLLSFCAIWALNYKIIWDPKFQRIIIWFLPFGIWASLTAFWSVEPVISLTRGLFYIYISSTAVLVGFLYGTKLNELFKLFLILNAIIISFSFLSLFSGIPSDAWTANHGMGFTSIFTHQNTLAAVLMFTLIGPVYYLIEYMYIVKSERAKGKSTVISIGARHSHDLLSEAGGQNLNSTEIDAELPQHDKKEARHSELACPPFFWWVSESKDFKRLRLESIFYFVLLISNLYFIYLSYSRSVMLSLFIGGLAFVYLIGSLKFNVIFTLIFFVGATTLFLSFHDGLTHYLKKSAPDYLGRRMILWEPSFKAALHGGVFGLGYGVTDPIVESNYKKENKFGELKREKGNSILALIEETGIVGLVLFFFPFGVILKFSFKAIFKLSKFIIHNSEFLIIITFLLAFLVHSQFEAWLVGVSSFYLLSSIVLGSLVVE